MPSASSNFVRVHPASGSAHGEEPMENMMEKLGYVAFTLIVVAAATLTTMAIREIPGIARYIKISTM
jgi:fructose-specific phosphotransferase system IIC component